MSLRRRAHVSSPSIAAVVVASTLLAIAACSSDDASSDGAGGGTSSSSGGNKGDGAAANGGDGGGGDGGPPGPGDRVVTVLDIALDPGETRTITLPDLIASDVGLEGAPPGAFFRKSTLDVTTYGATANDATDDTTAIQSALDAAKPGDVVSIPAGTYLISSALSPKVSTAVISRVTRRC